MISFMSGEIDKKEVEGNIWSYIEGKYKNIEEIEKHSYKRGEDFNHTTILSRSEAMEDIIILFQAILYNFKGIEKLFYVFTDMKEKVLKDLNNIETITNYDFEKILFRHLEEYCSKNIGINDFNPISIKKTYYYYSEKYEFLMDYKGYYTYLNGDKYYLKEREKYKAVDYIKKSINSKGEIVYYIGKNSSVKEPWINEEIVLLGEEEKYINLKLLRANSYDYREGFLEGKIYNHMPIVTFRDLQGLYKGKGSLKEKNTRFLLVDSYYRYMDIEILGEIKASNNIVSVGTRGFGEGFFINTKAYTLPNSNTLLTLYNDADNEDRLYFKPELYVDPNRVMERLKSLCYKI